jgi:hypothetical protein
MKHTKFPEPEHDNHGNGGYSEWWEIPGIARVYAEHTAYLIVRAVNCHDELVEALEEAESVLALVDKGVTIVTLQRTLPIIQKALAKAKGE